METKKPSIDRKEGTLWGLAWGDVFGSPIESWSESEIKRVFGEYQELPSKYPFEAIRALDPTGKRGKRLRPLGDHSDDTQQALALLAVCLQEGGFSPQVWASWLVEGQQRGAWRGTGRFFREAVKKLRSKIPPEKSGSPSAGMGASMRIAPLGALFSDKPQTLALVAMEASMTTHAHLVAALVAYAVAATVAGFVEGQTPDVIAAALPEQVAAVEEDWLRGRPEWVFDKSQAGVTPQVLRKALASDLSDHAAIQKLVTKLAKPHLADGFTKAHPNQGFALLGGLHALLVGIGLSSAPQDRLASVLRLGYDTDTVGAILGGILGARYGSSWIPKDAITDHLRIEAYACALASHGPPPETLDGFLQAEAALTKKEAAFQAGLL